MVATVYLPLPTLFVTGVTFSNFPREKIWAGKTAGVPTSGGPRPHNSEAVLCGMGDHTLHLHNAGQSDSDTNIKGTI